MEDIKNTQLAETEEAALANTNTPMGFEDEDASDMIIPRIKVVQALSPERKSGEAEEGDIINSLTKDKYNGKVFIPVFKFGNNIEWKDRADGGGIKCIARDGRIGEESDGTKKVCAQCRRCEFDNSKQGRDAVPKCTKYINFFGFISGEPMPIILSFAKTNYAEGKKLYSIAKVTMQNMWNYGYTLNNKVMAKNGNEWHIITVQSAGPSSDEERQFAAALYKQYRETIQQLQVDVEDTSVTEAPPAANVETTEF